MRLKAIACEIVFREVCFCAAKARNIVDLAFLPKGLHDIGTDKMLERLQQEVDAIDADRYEGVLLVYGLCNNGIVGLRAGSVPVIVPRAHDCITFFFGSKERYSQYFEEHPGTYYMTTGWKERNSISEEHAREGVMSQLGLNRTYEEYVAEYGEENAKFIMQTLGNWVENYDRYTYLRMGIADDLGYDRDTKERAARQGWQYDEQDGEIALLQRLFDGDWNEEEFLVVKSGQKIAASNDERIIATVAADEGEAA